MHARAFSPAYSACSARAAARACMPACCRARACAPTNKGQLVCTSACSARAAARACMPACCRPRCGTSGSAPRAWRRSRPGGTRGARRRLWRMWAGSELAAPRVYSARLVHAARERAARAWDRRARCMHRQAGSESDAPARFCLLTHAVPAHKSKNLTASDSVGGCSGTRWHAAARPRCSFARRSRSPRTAIPGGSALR